MSESCLIHNTTLRAKYILMTLQVYIVKHYGDLMVAYLGPYSSDWTAFVNKINLF